MPKLIDADQVISLTWVDVRTILVIGSDYAVELSRAGIKIKDMDNSEVYKEVLKRFIEARK